MNIEDKINTLITSEFQKGNRIGFRTSCQEICQYHNQMHTDHCWYSQDSIFYAKSDNIKGYIQLLEFRNQWFPHSKIQTFQIPQNKRF